MKIDDRMRRAALGALTLSATLLAGCAGGRARLRADSLEYPASLSKSVYDSAGRVVVPSDEQQCGHFSMAFRRWTLFWTSVSLSDEEVDLSAALREEVELRGGDAIVNLSVKAHNDPFWMVTSMVPLVPSAVWVEVEGDVVRISQE